MLMGANLSERQARRHAKNSLAPRAQYISDLIITERAGARINAAAATGRYIILMKHEHVYINYTLPFLFSTVPLMAARASRLAHGGQPRAED